MLPPGLSDPKGPLESRVPLTLDVKGDLGRCVCKAVSHWFLMLQLLGFPSFAPCSFH